MQPRLTIVTLGVADVATARAFYERLGWVASAASRPQIAFMDAGGPGGFAGGTVLSLFQRSALAADATVDDAPTGFAAMTLAINVGNEVGVTGFIAKAVAAGARQVKPAQKAFWGGFSGYFADPDGHLWEVAYNPHFTLDADGRLRLPPPV